jgi:hypothetical protein
MSSLFGTPSGSTLRDSPLGGRPVERTQGRIASPFPPFPLFRTLAPAFQLEFKKHKEVHQPEYRPLSLLFPEPFDLDHWGTALSSSGTTTGTTTGTTMSGSAMAGTTTTESSSLGVNTGRNHTTSRGATESGITSAYKSGYKSGYQGGYTNVLGPSDLGKFSNTNFSNRDYSSLSPEIEDILGDEEAEPSLIA